MALSDKEAKVLKAIKSMLDQDLLGLAIHEEPETAHNSQFKWSNINYYFRMKAADSPYAPYCDSMCAAFTKIHDHKYIDHPNFKIAMESEMRSMGLPTAVREAAVKFVDEIMEELTPDDPAERDAGWNAHMADLHDVTTNADTRDAKTSEPHTGGGPAPEGDRKLKMENKGRQRKKRK